jgi:hypothetical protein
MRVYWLAMGMLLFGFLAMASAQQSPVTPEQSQRDMITPAPGHMNIIIRETRAPQTVPTEAIVPPAVTVRLVQGKQAILRHEYNKLDSTVTKGDDIEGWTVISITDRAVTIEKKISDRRAFRALIPVRGVLPIQDQPTP